MISIMEAMSDKTKGRLKKAAKIGAGVGAAGAAGVAAYRNKDELTDYAKKAGKAVKKFVSGDKDAKIDARTAGRNVFSKADSDASEAARAKATRNARTAGRNIFSKADSDASEAARRNVRTGSDAGEAAKAKAKEVAKPRKRTAVIPRSSIKFSPPTPTHLDKDASVSDRARAKFKYKNTFLNKTRPSEATVPDNEPSLTEKIKKKLGWE